MEREEYQQTQAGKVHTALSNLQQACGFDTSESATEALFEALEEAVEGVRRGWGIVDQSHADGLAYDVNALLSDRIIEALER